ncbi:MAG: hypothetical protein M1508_13885 [Nitrospirae bacterium]|nr:hypothetical protein [Nitrospirota bacterium]
MRRIILSVLGICTATAVISSAAYAGPALDPGVHARMVNQQKRIWQGVNTGELTPREAGRLEAREAKIREDELRMKSDGVLTGAERARLHRELDRTSRAIYREKHDAQRAW